MRYAGHLLQEKESVGYVYLRHLSICNLFRVLNEASNCNYDPFMLDSLLFDVQAMKLNVSNLYGFPKGLFKVFLSILTSGEEALFLCGGVRS